MQKKKLGNKKVKPNPTLLDRFSWGKVLVFLAVMAPIVLLVTLLIKHSVNVPFYDQWELVDLFKKSHDGQLGFADFFAQHNEHRLLFPRLVMYSLARITNWNTNYEVATSVTLGVTAFWFLYQILRKTFVSNKKYLAISSILLSIVFFSPLQWENWMWGWQIQWFLNILGLIVAVWALTTYKASSSKRLIVAGIAATLATYSLASGMFVWFVCLPLIFFSKELKKYIPHWIGATLIIVGSHYIHYVNPSYHPSKTLFLHKPLEFIEYFTVYVVRPINFDYLLSIYFGVILAIIVLGLGTYIAVKKRADITGAYLPWLCFMLYALIAAATTDISRLGFGVTQGYANRYVTLSNFFVIGLIVILLKIYETTKHVDLVDRIARAASLIILTIGMLLVGLNYSKGIEQMKQQQRHLLKARQCAVHATSDEDDCLLLLYPNKPVVWRRLNYLRATHWSDL